jgi:hypothetical protein
MLTQLSSYFSKMFDTQKHSQYGSELEQYIVSKHPQSVAEIDHWTRQFDKNQTQQGWPL